MLTIGLSSVRPVERPPVHRPTCWYERVGLIIMHKSNRQACRTTHSNAAKLPCESNHATPHPLLLTYGFQDDWRYDEPNYWE